MIDKIKNLDPNFRLKVVSFLLAVVTWYMINYFSDPAIRMTVNNVKVDILHGEVIEDRGDVYTVLDNTDVIPVVTLQAKRSVIDKLESKNIIATADARDMMDDGSVRIVLTTDKYSSSIERISGSISNVLLRVEPKETRSINLDVDTEGRPADGFILYETDAEQNQVSISGPQSYVNEVGRAAASVDITGAEKSINSYPDITLYDQEGIEITAEEIKTHKLHVNISSVKVIATIYQTKEVGITCGSEVPLAYGYKLESEPVAEPSSILIAGAAGILRDIDTIEIPAEDISQETLYTNMHKLLKIRKYLPDGVVLADDSQENVTVFVRVTLDTGTEETETDQLDDQSGEAATDASTETSADADTK